MQDSKIERKKLHLLKNIVFITVADMICGCKSWYEVEDFGKAKRDWLSGILDLSNGIPSHDTFNRGFRIIKPQSRFKNIC